VTLHPAHNRKWQFLSFLFHWLVQNKQDNQHDRQAHQHEQRFVVAGNMVKFLADKYKKLFHEMYFFTHLGK